MISWSSSFASSTPGDVLEGDLLLRARRQLRLALAERERFIAAALHLAHEEDPEADHQQHRRPRIEQRRPRAGGRFLRLDHDAALDQLVDEAFVLIGSVGMEGLVVGVDASDVLTGDDDALDLPGFGRSHEVAEPDLLLVLLQFGRHVPDEDADNDDHHPEQQALQGRIQAEPPQSLSLKIITACAGSRTRNSASAEWPATHTIRSRSSTTNGTASRRSRGTLRSTKKSCSFFRPLSPGGRNQSPVRRFLTENGPAHRSTGTTCVRSPSRRSGHVELSPRRNGCRGRHRTVRLGHFDLTGHRQGIRERRCDGTSGTALRPPP